MLWEFYFYERKIRLAKTFPASNWFSHMWQNKTLRLQILVCICLRGPTQPLRKILRLAHKHSNQCSITLFQENLLLNQKDKSLNEWKQLWGMVFRKDYWKMYHPNSILIRVWPTTALRPNWACHLFLNSLQAKNGFCLFKLLKKK